MKALLERLTLRKRNLENQAQDHLGRATANLINMDVSRAAAFMTEHKVILARTSELTYVIEELEREIRDA